MAIRDDENIGGSKQMRGDSHDSNIEIQGKRRQRRQKDEEMMGELKTGWAILTIQISRQKGQEEKGKAKDEEKMGELEKGEAILTIQISTQKCQEEKRKAKDDGKSGRIK